MKRYLGVVFLLIMGAAATVGSLSCFHVGGAEKISDGVLGVLFAVGCCKFAFDIMREKPKDTHPEGGVFERAAINVDEESTDLYRRYSSLCADCEPTEGFLSAQKP